MIINIPLYQLRNYPSFFELHELLFGPTYSGQLLHQLEEKKNVQILAFKEKERIVAYKLGYEVNKHTFYSWLGGVHPAHRRKGIASSLMSYQHDYCQGAGYTRITTKTTNKWRDMLILNLQHGFQIVGTYVDHEKEIKIMLEKTI